MRDGGHLGALVFVTIQRPTDYEDVDESAVAAYAQVSGWISCPELTVSSRRCPAHGMAGRASGDCRLAGNGRIVVLGITREGWWQAMAADPEINLVDPDVYLRSGAPHEQSTWLREHAPVFWV